MVVLLVAGCTQPPSSEGRAVDYLATQAADMDAAGQALVARAVAAHGRDLQSWPSSQAPLAEDLAPSSLPAAIHGLVATGRSEFAQAVWDAHDGEQFGNPASLADDMLAAHALLVNEFNASEARLSAAVDRIAAAQAPDGGWRFDGSTIGEVDETAWALMALVAADALADHQAQAATDFLVRSQGPGGLAVYQSQENCQSTGWLLVAWSQLGTDAPPSARAALLACQNEDGGFGLTPGAPSQPWVTADVLIGLAA